MPSSAPVDGQGGAGHRVALPPEMAAAQGQELQDTYAQVTGAPMPVALCCCSCQGMTPAGVRAWLFCACPTGAGCHHMRLWPAAVKMRR